MRSSRLLVVIMSMVFMTSLFLCNGISAEDSVDAIVDADFDISFLDGTHLDINITMNVIEAVAFGVVYDSLGIRDLAVSTEHDDIEALGVIKSNLHNSLENQIEGVFENANIVSLNNKPRYKSMVFYENYVVNFTSVFFGVDEKVNVYNLVNGVLDMGAVVTYNFDLQAENGWNNTFRFVLPDSISLEFANTDKFDSNKNEVTWVLENWDGENPEESAVLKSGFVNPTTSKLEDEDIFIEFELDTGDVETTSLKTVISATDLDIRDYDFLPDFVTNLDFVPADGIRLFIDTGLTSWDTFYNTTIKPLRGNIVSKLENSSLNQTMDMVFNWNSETTTNCTNPYNVTYMDDELPIKAELEDEDVELRICGVSTRGMFGLINAGAEANISQEDINFGDNLGEIGHNYNITLFMPNNIFLDGENIYSWNNNKSISGEFESNISEEYSEEKIDTIIEIEVKGTDLNLFSFITGKTELTLSLYLEEGRDYCVTTLPNEFSLPEKISLDYLNSDVFRLCVEEEIFKEKNVTDFLTDEKTKFEQMMKNIFQLPGFTVDGRVKRDVFDSSIRRWDGDIADMDADTPVEVVSYAYSSYPVTFNLSFLPPSFEIVDQSFNFTGLQNQNVTYRMILPPGIAVFVNDSLNRADVKETSDGRQYIEIEFDPSESGVVDTVKLKFVPSLFFILGVFMPCIVSLIITIILIVVIYLIRKKRKGVAVVKENEVLEDYEEQDYYVPPPPSSK